MKKEAQQNYANTYSEYLKSIGIKVKNKFELKDYLKILFIVFIIICVFDILFLIPPTRKILISLYENNIVIRCIANIIFSIFELIGDILNFNI